MNIMEHKIISVDELYGVYRDPQPLEIIVDVRPDEEVVQNRIEGSLGVPFSLIEGNPAFCSNKLKQYKNAYIVGSDGEMARAAYDALNRAGCNNLMYVAIGGMGEWIRKGYPVLADGKADKDAQTPDWQLDYRRIDKRAWLLEQLQLGPMKALGIEGAFIIYEPEARRGVLLYPQQQQAHHIIEQLIRKGLTLKAVVGSGKCAEQIATDFRAPLLNDKDGVLPREGLLGAPCELLAQGGLSWLGYCWQQGSEPKVLGS